MSGTTISGSIVSYTVSGDGFVLTNLGTIGSTALVGVTVNGNSDTVINDGTISGYDGVKFNGSGALTNALGGVIEGTGFNGFGVLLTAAGTVENAGSIIGGHLYGVRLEAGGSFTNDASGFITASAAFEINGGTAVNAGRLISSTILPFHQGADVSGGGILTNVSGGTIVGYFGIAVYKDATITNAGSVGGGLFGVQLFNGGTLTNDTGGLITGQDGVTAFGSAWIDNAGTISGNDVGVYLKHGYLTNQSSGTITSNGSGVLTEGGATLLNAGSIGASGDGVNALIGGQITNQAGGTLSGGAGVALGAFGTLVNDALITGSGGGVTIYGEGFVTNNAGATITGTRVGVGAYGVPNFIYLGPYYGFERDGYQTGYAFITNAGLISGAYGVEVQHANATVVDTGTISGSIAAVEFGANYNDRLRLYSGAVLDGAVIGGAGTLELASSAGIGTLSGIGTQITGFAQIIVDPGADWLLTGNNTFDPSATVVNYGTLQIGGTASFASGSPHRLVVHQGSTIIGTIDGGNTTGSIFASAIELASAAGVGTLGGIGTTYRDFSQVIVDPGADWLLAPNTIGPGVTLSNRGTVGATGGASVVFAPGAGNRVVLYAGATFQGTVDGGNPYGSTYQSVLELTGYTPATLNGLGTQYLNFAQIDIDNGATWSLGSSLVAGSTLTDAGYLTGTPNAVLFASGVGNRLVLDSGAIVSGIADGGNTIGSGMISTLELASSGGHGSLSGIGSQFVDFAAVTLDAGAYWTLANSNTLAGGSIAVAGTLANIGTLVGNVTLPDGTLLNQFGTIDGVVSGDATVNNSGTILGNNGTAVSLTGSDNLIVVYPNAEFDGSVNGGGSATLELENGGVPGTLTGLGTQFTGFTTVAVYTGADWSLGNATLAPGTTLTNAGTLEGDATFAAGAGNRVIDQAGTFTGIINGGNTIGAAYQSTLELAKALEPGAFTGTISGLGSQFVNFSFVTIDVDASWKAYGINTIGGTLLDAGNLYNGGTLDGTVTLAGELSNEYQINGAVIGTAAGVDLNNRGGTIANGSGAAVSVAAGTYLYASNNGLISGTTYGVVSMGPGKIGNNGTISGNAAGVVLGPGATLGNQGVIVGGSGVVLLGNSGGGVSNSGDIYGGVTQQGSGAVTIYNNNYIQGTNYAVSLASGSANLVQMYPGAHFSGIVDGGDPSSMPVSKLELLARYNPLVDGGAPGTVTGLGTSYVGFGQVQIDTKAVWAIVGNSTVTSLTNNGTLTFDGSLSADTLINNGTLTLGGGTIAAIATKNYGLITLTNGATLEVTGSVAGQPGISFAGGGLLRLDSPANVNAYVQYFRPGETIDLSGVNPSSVTFNSDSEVLNFTVTDVGPGQFYLGLASGQSLATPTSDGTGGTDIAVACFLRGTLIETPDKAVPVEALAIGDHVLTLSGNARPIKWIGRRAYAGRFAANRTVQPIQIRAGALDEDVPRRDLYVSPQHALFIDDVLAPAEKLVNGVSIVRCARMEVVEYFHIELETHDVLLAEGAPAESFADCGNRAMFHNGAEFAALYPNDKRAAWTFCARRVDAGDDLARIRWKLEQRFGWFDAETTRDPGLHLMVDGERVDAASRHGEVVAFRLKRRPQSVRIVSRSAAPDQLGPECDSRELGVALRRIMLARGRRLALIEAQDARLADGFHGFEEGGGIRWTNGDAALPAELFDGFDGPVQVELTVAGAMQYVVMGEAA
jgi:Hint domain